MSTSSEIVGVQNFLYEWHIQNFDYCWHKTGEYLSSNLFVVPSLGNSTWRLRLYPRGEDDGEYVGCFLCREAEGGPESVSVDFELSLSFENSHIASPVSFVKIYSFKKSQVEGLKCFASRWEVFAPTAAHMEGFTLILTCEFLNIKAEEPGQMEQLGCTRINVESIDGVEEFSGEDAKCVHIKPFLEYQPLISIKVCQFDESLIVKMIPQTCELIRYAICKFSIIRNWPNASPIKEVWHWIGKVQEHTWRYNEPIAESDSTKTPKSATFFLCYEFSYATGESSPMKGIVDFDAHMLQQVSLPKSWNINGEIYAPTASDALTHHWPSFDIHLGHGTEMKKGFPAHKALLCARSSYFKSIITKDIKYVNIDLNLEDDSYFKFVVFMYLDILFNATWKEAYDLYCIAHVCEVDRLKSMCATFLADNLDSHTAVLILETAHKYKDAFLKTVAENYILKYDVEVFCTREWHMFAKTNQEIARETMLLKFSKE